MEKNKKLDKDLILKNAKKIRKALSSILDVAESFETEKELISLINSLSNFVFLLKRSVPTKVDKNKEPSKIITNQSSKIIIPK